MFSPARYVRLANLQAGYLILLIPYSHLRCSTEILLSEGRGYRRTKLNRAKNQRKIMSDEQKNPTRKHGRHLRVPVLPDEENEIKANAAKAGLTTAEYLRRVGLGYEIRAMIDNQQVAVLAKINADLGRLGGLLKLWLTNDERLAHISPQTMTTVLERIQSTQAAMLDVVQKL